MCQHESLGYLRVWKLNKYIVQAHDMLFSADFHHIPWRNGEDRVRKEQYSLSDIKQKEWSVALGNIQESHLTFPKSYPHKDKNPSQWRAKANLSSVIQRLTPQTMPWRGIIETNSDSWLEETKTILELKSKKIKKTIPMVNC